MDNAITVLVITLRTAWPAAWVLAAFCLFGVFSLKGGPFPPLSAFLLLFLPLLALSAWGGINWAAEGGRNTSHWRGTAHNILAILSILFTFLVPWLYRRSPRLWILGPAVLASIVLTAGAWFVGAMAITDSWL